MTMPSTEGMTLVGVGILSWNGLERRSNRYGSIHLYNKTYKGEHPGVPVRHDYLTLLRFETKRVRIVAKVIESRESGHIGDIFLGIRPSKTEVGACIDLGIGTLETIMNTYDQRPDLVLHPDDGRSELWFDPRLLYRLHDHTVEIYMQETDEKAVAATVEASDGKPAAVETGDGALQFKHVGDGDQWRVPPAIHDLGDGMFVVESPMKGVVGNRVPVDVRKKARK